MTSLYQRVSPIISLRANPQKSWSPYAMRNGGCHRFRCWLTREGPRICEPLRRSGSRLESARLAILFMYRIEPLPSKVSNNYFPNADTWWSTASSSRRDFRLDSSGTVAVSKLVTLRSLSIPSRSRSPTNYISCRCRPGRRLLIAAARATICCCCATISRAMNFVISIGRRPRARVV